MISTLERRGPDFELLDGGGAEGVGGAEDHRGAFFLPAVGELADGGGFAGAVDADDEENAGRWRGAIRRLTLVAGAVRILTIWRFSS